MNILMHCKKIDINTIDFNNANISSFNILTQILPNLSLKYKTKRFKDDEDYETSNNVFEVNNGILLRGHIEKGILGDTTRGLLQRIYNDFGVDASQDFVDDLQDIVTEYMKIHGYSVGISDLIADKDTIDNGVTFDLDAGNDNLVIEGDFLNNGTFYNRPNYYTLGISKYFGRGYGFKIQGDITYNEALDGSNYIYGTPMNGNEWVFRIITTISF